MSRFLRIFLMAVVLLSALGAAGSARAAGKFCFISSDWMKLSAEQAKTDNLDDASLWGAQCAEISKQTADPEGKKGGGECKIELPAGVKGYREPTVKVVPTQTACDDEMKIWRAKKEANKKSQGGAQGATVQPGGAQKFVPPCLFEQHLSPGCKNINIFVELLINIARFLFTIVGAVALAAFIYGGFVLILSQGSSEKIKKGTDAMAAALIGLIIVFSAYMLVRFLGKAIQIQPTYELVE